MHCGNVVCNGSGSQPSIHIKEGPLYLNQIFRRNIRYLNFLNSGVIWDPNLLRARTKPTSATQAGEDSSGKSILGRVIVFALQADNKRFIKEHTGYLLGSKLQTSVF